MREIKFRGKRLDNGEWVYGLPLYESGGPFIGKISTWYEPGDERTYAEIEIDPKTVGEYIGLKDRNGKEICEGDVCSYFYLKGKEFIAVVKYNRHGCCFHMDLHEKLSGGSDSKVIQHELSDDFEDGETYLNPHIEVIGNIHDNPELINK